MWLASSVAHYEGETRLNRCKLTYILGQRCPRCRHTLHVERCSCCRCRNTHTPLGTCCVLGFICGSTGRSTLCSLCASPLFVYFSKHNAQKTKTQSNNMLQGGVAVASAFVALHRRCRWASAAVSPVASVAFCFWDL